MERHLSVAIIGGGPRGIAALDELLLRSGRARIHITIYDETGEFGAGNIYSVDQPNYLLMNFASEHIDIWSEHSRKQFPLTRPTLVEWLHQRNPDISPEGSFIPRREVGRYLFDCLQESLARCPENTTIKMRSDSVVNVDPGEKGWLVETAHECNLFDEVLLCVGHEGWRAPDEKRADEISGIFPVTKQLSEENVPPGSTVSIKGFSLTWIDAAIALSEGRGGRFRDEFSRGGRVYEKSGYEPGRISPHSRTGRPMLAKPLAGKMKLSTSLAEHWEECRSLVSTLDSEQFFRNFRNLLFAAANEAIQKCGVVPEHSAARWFETWLATAGEPVMAQKLMVKSIDVAHGRTSVDCAWAIGEAWRQLYSALVRKCEHGQLPTSSWPAFQEFSCEMERIAFGPPACNLSKILALIECGIVDLASSEHLRDAADISIDARIAAPTRFREGSILNQLLKNGYLRHLHGRLGIETDRDGCAIDRGGQRVQGLSVIGRATEGCVIGNDTLSRTLNKHPERWAQKIVAASNVNCRPRSQVSASAVA